MAELDPQQLHHLARKESPLVTAHLVRLVRDLSTAEDLLQEAWTKCVVEWQRAGLPPNPGAYLMKVAHHRALDLLRRGKKVSGWNEQLAAESDFAVAALDEGEVFPDERLRLVFTCCHPSLALEAQVALTLKHVCGLTTGEVARAFLVPEPTIAQRMVRAKRLISDQAIGWEVPEPDQLAPRLDAVLQVFLLLFNEGYTASSGEALMRQELKDEAVRLTALVVDALPAEPEARGLLALLLLLEARAATRVDAEGALVLLEAQDRSQWNADLIQRGLDALRLAEVHGQPGRFQVQAHIAATHAVARSWEETNWPRIAHLYRALELIAPSPITTLNRAVAVSMVDGPAAALQLVDELATERTLREYHLLPATRADLLRRLGRLPEARTEYERAAGLTSNERERAYLLGRAASCSNSLPLPPGEGLG